MSRDSSPRRRSTRARRQRRGIAPVQHDHGDAWRRAGGIGSITGQASAGASALRRWRKRAIRRRGTALGTGGERGHPSASIGGHRMAVRVPVGIRRRGAGLDVERRCRASSARRGTWRCRRRPRGRRCPSSSRWAAGPAEHDRHLVLARHDAQRDAHGLVGPVGHARVFRDHHAARGWPVGHAVSSARRSGRCR